jgi:glutamate-1-semialdehyde 2,1-aminomutase
MRKKSAAIYQRACSLIPGGVNSPVRSFRHLKMDPLIIESGKGDLLYDLDGHQYIDFCCSWGSLILGHAHPQIVKSVCEQMTKGSSFGISTALETEIAAKIVELVPSIEKLRFVSSGTEAVMTALRLARGYTGRPKILKFTGHYHGHVDSLLIQAGSGLANLNTTATSKGIGPNSIADTICLPFNDFDAARSFFKNKEMASQLAAVILEPVTGNMGVVLPEKGFLEMLREETKRIGALLIFDEVITGFRLGIKGAQGIYSIEPDLTTLGKIIGGGFPAAAVGGKAKILDCLAPLGEVYQAGTLSGNPVAIRAGLETLRFIEKEDVYKTLKEKTERLTAPIVKAIKEKEVNACLQQAGSMFTLFFGLKEVKCKEDLKALEEEKFIQFFHYLFERGIYISPSSHEASFLSLAHSNEHIDQASEAIVSFIKDYL